MQRALSLLLCVLVPAGVCAGCYESHRAPRWIIGEPPDGRASGIAGTPGGRVPGRDDPREDGDDPRSDDPRVRPRQNMSLPERPKHMRPSLPPVECRAVPAPECVSSFPRVMIVMDASSSMLAGRREGQNNWDKARFALAGNPKTAPGQPGYVQPAFARELDIRGNTVTMEDVFHLGLIVWNAKDLQRLVLQYTPCASDNIAWAMDPYVSCDAPGCSDPYGEMPRWTYKNSRTDRTPPFVQTTLSYVPPCNQGGPVPCVGGTYNTYAAEGLAFAADNVELYRRNAQGIEVNGSTRFANILITDGETAPDSHPEAILERMAAAGVPTYVIGLEPQGPGADVEEALAELDRYAQLGGTEYATLVEADERDIADAFAEAVTRVIDEIGTDPCCQPTHCAENPEPLVLPGLGVL